MLASIALNTLLNIPLKTTVQNPYWTQLINSGKRYLYNLKPVARNMMYVQALLIERSVLIPLQNPHMEELNQAYAFLQPT
jgi:hypothetical protein